MFSIRLSVTLLAFVSFLSVSTPAAPLATQQLLDRANQASVIAYSSLQSFICDERIDRFRSSLDGSRLRPIDAITASLSFENGSEHYADIRQNDHSRGNLSSLSGAWSEGEFGSLLRQTGQLLRAEPVSFERQEQLNGDATSVYSFNVNTAESPWELVIESQVYRLPFQTQVWISEATGDIVRVARRAVAIPHSAGISSIEWSVSLREVRLNDSNWLLPASADYAVSYGERNRREWNHMSFDNYHRYSSQVALSFGTPGAGE